MKNIIIICLAGIFALFACYGELVQYLAGHDEIPWRWYYGHIGDFNTTAFLAIIIIPWIAKEKYSSACLGCALGYTLIEFYEITGHGLLPMGAATYDPLDVIAYNGGSLLGYLIGSLIYKFNLNPSVRY